MGSFETTAMEGIEDVAEMRRETWRRDGDFYFNQADHAEGEDRARLLQMARDYYLKGDATKEARCVERALDRLRPRWIG